MRGVNDDPSLALRFAMHKSFLIVAMGDKSAEEVLQKIEGRDKGPQWLLALLTESKIKRPLSVWQVNVDSIWETIDPLLKDPVIRGALDASGKVRDLETDCLGLEDSTNSAASTR